MTRYEPPSPRIVQFLLAAIFMIPLIIATSQASFAAAAVITVCAAISIASGEFFIMLGSIVLILTISLFISLQVQDSRYIIADLLFLSIPTLLWIIFYFGVPHIMLMHGILPKKANANLLSFFIGILTILLFSFFSGQLISNLNSQNIFLHLYYTMPRILGVASFITIPSLLILSGISIVSIFNPPSIPPLDLVDAKKLDDAVSKQVESVLKPMLERGNYTTEQISEILTRTSLGRIQFRR